MLEWLPKLFLASANDALPPEGKARVMLVVILAILVSLLGFVCITLVRIIHRRSTERIKRAGVRSADEAKAWDIAGQRAEPVDDGEIRNG